MGKRIPSRAVVAMLIVEAIILGLAIFLFVYK